jgi:hypothetical protein
MTQNQLDLFPTSEPEIKGQLTAFAVVLRGLIEALIANGSLTVLRFGTNCKARCRTPNCGEWKNRRRGFLMV